MFIVSMTLLMSLNIFGLTAEVEFICSGIISYYYAVAWQKCVGAGRGQVPATYVASEDGTDLCLRLGWWPRPDHYGRTAGVRPTSW